MLAHGDIVGTDHAGRTVLQLAVDQWTLDQLCAFDAGSEDLEDADAEPELDETDSAPVMLDALRAKRTSLAPRYLPAVAVACLLVTMPQMDARADQAPAVTLPITMQTAPQCCRVCRKGKACGDGCISAERQCTKDQGCACSALNIGS